MAQENFVPTMTSDTAPSGTVAVDSYTSANYGWKAFDGNAATQWAAGTLVGAFAPHWITYEFTSTKIINQFRFKAPDAANWQHPVSFELQGWNGSAWDTLHSVAGMTALARAAWSDMFDVTSPGSYAKYRLYVTAASAGAWTDLVMMAALELIGFVPTFTPPTGRVTVGAVAPMFVVGGDYVAVPFAARVTVDSSPPTFEAGLAVPAPAAVTVAAGAPGYSWAVPAGRSWQQVYRLTLTGAADGVDDIELPMSSFQSRARAEAQTYIGAQVPYTAAIAAAVAARPGGTLIITGGPRYADGTENLAEVVRATLSRVDVDRGAVNGSIALHGYYDAVARLAQSRVMTGVSYVRTGETNQIRCSVDIWLRPGDTAIDPETGLAVVVSSISYVIGTQRQEMTVSDGNG